MVEAWQLTPSQAPPVASDLSSAIGTACIDGTPINETPVNEARIAAYRPDAADSGDPPAAR